MLGSAARFRSGENGPHDLVLKARGLAVGGKARARLLHPALHNERLRRCARDAGNRCAGDDRAFEKDPTTEHPIAGCRQWPPGSFPGLRLSTIEVVQLNPG